METVVGAGKGAVETVVEAGKGAVETVVEAGKGAVETAVEKAVADCKQKTTRHMGGKGCYIAHKPRYRKGKGKRASRCAYRGFSTWEEEGSDEAEVAPVLVGWTCRTSIFGQRAKSGSEPAIDVPEQRTAHANNTISPLRLCCIFRISELHCGTIQTG